MAAQKSIFDNPFISVLSGLVLLSIVAYLGVGTVNQIKEGRYIGRPTTERDTISIQGEGKVTAVPDIGQISVSIVTRNKDVSRAQEDNITQFNSLVEALKTEGIDKMDLTTTNYSVYPQYDYTDGRQTLIAYEVRQSLMVKIRDLDNAGRIITLAGQNGVNEVSGLNFTIDEPEALQNEAREKALVNAREKAETLAKLAGVKLGKIVSFSESTNGVVAPTPYFYDKALEGRGGAGNLSEPTFEQGSQDVVVYANIVYEIY
jgi:uncharacterized protein YggE